MIIPKQTLSQWKRVREQGDLTNMEKTSEKIAGEKVTRQRIARALELGRCNEKTYKVLDKYYSKKLRLIAA